MIRLLTDEKEADIKLLKKDVFGTRILAYFNTYSTKFPFLSVWYQQNGSGKITAFISSMEGTGTLTAADDADYEELSAFIDMLPLKSLQSQRAVFNKLKRKEKLHGNVVRYVDSSCKEKKYEIIRNPQLSDVYAIINAAGLLGTGNYLEWLSDTTSRVNAGTALAAGIYSKGKLVSCAMKLFITPDAVLLGAVATDPAERGKGMAGEIVHTLAEECAAQNKRTELLCANGSITEFYKSTGFIIADEWSMG